MAVKSFVVGELATSADVNTYLANAGLVYITETTAATVATKALPGIFTSTFENYRIVITNLTTNIAGLLTVTLGAANTNYSYAYAGQTYAGAADTLFLNAGAFWSIARTTATSSGSVIVDIFRPQIAANTTFTGINMSSTGSLAGGGIHTTAAAYTDLNLGLFTAATFSANIKIYGYRQA